MPFETPILLIIFNRPEKTSKLINVLSKIKPKNIYVSADGPRENSVNDKELCKEVRNQFDKLPWDCKVTKKFSENNLSCKRNVIESINWFFENNKHGIILEDDCIPSITFFSFCEKLLDKYDLNQKIMQINGFNGGLKYFDSNNASYFFSKLNTTWGWATWKRAWLKFDNNFDGYENFKNKLEDYYENSDIAEWMKLYFDKSISNKDNIWSTNWSYTILKNDGLCISPMKNLVENIGFDNSATSGKSELFSKFSKSVDNNFTLDEFTNTIVYKKENDEKFFYDLVEKIDQRAKKNILYKIKKIFMK